MNRKILLVDDEPNLLEALKRNLRGKFVIETALSGKEALEIISEDGPFAVIISDYKMPEMNGVEFLAKAMEKAPNSIRMMLTGQADMDAAIEVINNVRIFRFLLKPCPVDALIENIEDGIEQYRLKYAEKELIEKTLSGSIKVLTDVLSLVNPLAFSKALRVRRLVKLLLEKTKIDNPWQVEIAAMLSQLGCVTVPDSILKKVYNNESLFPYEERMFYKHPQVGCNMLANIPRLEKISEIVNYQEKLFNGAGIPEGGKEGSEIPLGARILKVIIDYDSLTCSKIITSNIFEIMKRRVTAGWYDPDVLSAFEKVVTRQQKHTVKEVFITQLKEGMILADSIETDSHVIVASRGQEVSQSLLTKIKNIENNIQKNKSVKIIELEI